MNFVMSFQNSNQKLNTVTMIKDSTTKTNRTIFVPQKTSTEICNMKRRMLMQGVN